jgi:uncharacterized protein YihD (DUF1040 family)
MTRDPERIDEVLEELEEYWKENPDLRLGQIIANIAQYRCGFTDPFYISDDDMLRTIREKKDDS